MQEIINLLKKSILLELVFNDLNIELNSKDNNIDAYRKNITNSDLAKIVYDSLISYTFDSAEIEKYDNSFSTPELRRYAINTSFRILLNDEKNNPMSIDELYEKNKSLGFYGDLLMELFLHAFYGTNKLICRGKLYDPNSRMEPTGFDAFHIISGDDFSEFWLGESKISNSKNPGEIIKKIIFSFDTVFRENYLRENLLLITKRNLTTSDSKFSKFLEERKLKLGLKNIDLINDLVNETKIDSYIYPIFICYEMKNSIAESVKYVKTKIIDNIKDFNEKIGPISTYNEIGAKIFFILFPIEAVDEYRKAVLEWIIQEG